MEMQMRRLVIFHDSVSYSLDRIKYLERDGINENQHFFPARAGMLYYVKWSSFGNCPHVAECVFVPRLHLFGCSGT